MFVLLSIYIPGHIYCKFQLVLVMEKYYVFFVNRRYGIFKLYLDKFHILER